MIDKDLLKYIPADCSYDEWIKVGMALKHEGADWTVWDDWSRTGAGAASHTSGDEKHLGVFVKELVDVVFAHFGRFTAFGGVVARSEVALAQMQLGFHVAFRQGLVIGVAEDEVDSLYAFLHHVVDGIAATTANANDLDVIGHHGSHGLEQFVVVVLIFHILVFCFI